MEASETPAEGTPADQVGSGEEDVQPSGQPDEQPAEGDEGTGEPIGTQGAEQVDAEPHTGETDGGEDAEGE